LRWQLAWETGVRIKFRVNDKSCTCLYIVRSSLCAIKYTLSRITLTYSYVSLGIKKEEKICNIQEVSYFTTLVTRIYDNLPNEDDKKSWK